MIDDEARRLGLWIITAAIGLLIVAAMASAGDIGATGPVQLR